MKYKVNEIKEPEIVWAKHAFVTRQQPLLDKASALFGRNSDGLCVKVFYGNPLKKGEDLREALWGDNPDLNNTNDIRKNTILRVGTQIQNICNIEGGISPRIYGIFEAEYRGKRVACQLTDFVEGECAETLEEVDEVFSKIKEIGDRFDFACIQDIQNHKDLIGGKFVDLQPFAFGEEAKYRDVIKEIYVDKAKYGKVYYQDVPELGFSGGPRKSKKREEWMRLDEIDFKDKVVWDIGCAGGYFCRYAYSHGAKRVIGIDEAGPIYAAKHLANYLEMFNIDFEVRDLLKDNLLDLPKPDIVFFLSVNLHIGIPEVLKEVPLVVFEDNSRDRRNEANPGEPWNSWFSRIELVGRGEDHGNKSCYILKK